MNKLTQRTLRLYFPIGLLIASLLLFNSCEDVIEIETENSTDQIVVDAWITNQSIAQTITLSQSQGYFDNNAPPAINDASVVVSNSNGSIYDFENLNNDGKYVWTPHNEETLGSVGDELTLSINVSGDQYESITIIKRVPTLDSLIQEYRENEIFLDDGIYVEFFARDFVGTGDSYWIKAFKNGNYLSKASELNIAFDAGFDAGSQIDGLIFIPPIRDFVNELDEDDIDLPWEVGEVSRVEIHSLSLEAFNFLEIARDQINNGSNGIFSLPLANTRSNIENTSGGFSPLGFFNVAAVSSKEIVIE